MKPQVQKITQLYFKSIELFNEMMAQPRDYGTGEEFYYSEVHVVEAIGDAGEINLTEIAIALDISKSAVSKVVKKLLARKCINKYKLPDNQKEVLFSLTEKGEAVYQAHERFGHRKFQNTVTAMESMSKEELNTLEHFMQVLINDVVAE